MIFARKITPSLTSLVKTLDKATVENTSCHMGSFVVLLSDDDKQATTQLKDLASQESLKKVALTVDSSAGPGDYDIAKDAEITVVLYVRKTVKVNHAYKPGEFTDKEIPTIIRDLGKILPENKRG